MSDPACNAVSRAFSLNVGLNAWIVSWAIPLKSTGVGLVAAVNLSTCCKGVSLLGSWSAVLVKVEVSTVIGVVSGPFVLVSNWPVASLNLEL